MTRGDVLFGCGDKMWVPLMGIWGITSYAPLMVRKQNASGQFIPVTKGLSQFECSYGDPGYLKRITEVAKDWKETHRILSGQYTNIATSGYLEWKLRQVGGSPTPPINESIQPADPQPKEVLSEGLIPEEKQDRYNEQFKR